MQNPGERKEILVIFRLDQKLAKSDADLSRKEGEKDKIREIKPKRLFSRLPYLEECDCPL